MPEQACHTCKYWKRFTLPKDYHIGVCSNEDHKKEVYPDRTYGYRLISGEFDLCKFWTEVV